MQQDELRLKILEDQINIFFDAYVNTGIRVYSEEVKDKLRVYQRAGGKKCLEEILGQKKPSILT